MTVDGRDAFIGSYNFDPRSAKLNTECGVVITDEAFTTLVEDTIRNMVAPGNSWVVGKRYEKEGLLSRFSGVIGSISTALPIFDIWPYRYTTVYDLRDGMDPVLSRDPGFYQRYRDVGQFPEVDSIGTDIQTRLFKAFGGWANPLM